MFESYKVFVKIALVNEVSKGLVAMSGQFAQLNRDAERLNASLGKIKKLAMFGGGMAAAGLVGLYGLAKALKPAEEYTHQLNIMNMAGMKQQEIAEAVAAAWQTTHKVLNTTATGNLKTILDLRNVFGNTNEAIQYLPEIAKISTVLKSSSSGTVKDNADDLSYSLAKALDMRGAVLNSTLFNQQAEAMAKVIVATQGRVNPEDYRQLFKYSRQATMGLSNEFLYQELPTFMLEMKGKSGSGAHGGFGTSIAAFYRFFVQGVMSKAAVQGLQSIGLLGSNVGLKTTTTGTMLLGGQHVKGVELAASDPFQYISKVFLPAIFKKYGDNLTQQQLGIIISSIMKGSSSTAQFAVSQFAFKEQNVYRDQKIIQQAKDVNQAYALAMSNDPVAINAALGAQWENFKTAFGMAVVPVILPGLMKLTEGLNALAQFIRQHQDITKGLAFAFAGLSASLAFSGTVMLLTAAMKGLSLALSLVGAGGVIPKLAGLFTLMGRLGAAGLVLGASYEGTKAIVTHYGVDKKGGSLLYNLFGNNLYNWTHHTPIPANAPSMIGATSSSSHAQPTQGVVYLDSHQVGNFLFGSGMNHALNTQSLSSLNRVNASISPMAHDSVAPY